MKKIFWARVSIIKPKLRHKGEWLDIVTRKRSKKVMKMPGLNGMSGLFHLCEGSCLCATSPTGNTNRVLYCYGEVTFFFFSPNLTSSWLYFYSFPSVHAIERWRRKSQKWLASSLWQLKKLGKVSKLFCETSSEFNISSEICLKNEYDSPPLCIKEYNNNWCWWWWRWCWRCSGAP